jgi:hypothetical protein
MLELENIIPLYKKLKFDYIYINPKNIKDVDFEVINEELLADFNGPPNYLSKLRVNETTIDVFWNPNVTIGEFTYHYNDIKKERNVKLSNLPDSK